MTYQFPVFLPITVLLAGIVIAVLAIFLMKRRTRKRFTLPLLAFSAVCLAIVAPGMFADRVVLDDQKIKQTTGLWFAPMEKGFTLAEVAAIHIGTAPDRKDRPMVAWFVRGKDGSVTQVNPGDLWKLHSTDIVRRLKGRGIIVTDAGEFGF